MADYFPGGHIWPYSELKRHNTHLQLVDSWFNNGMNYWKTLDEWHKRFWRAIDQLYPEFLSVNEVKTWNDYFVLSKSMFYPDHGRSYGVGQYLYEKY
jgi:cyclopropane-fatty-acyl-phospholipid synthase